MCVKLNNKLMLGFQEIQSFLQVLNQRQFSPVNINT